MPFEGIEAVETASNAIFNDGSVKTIGNEYYEDRPLLYEDEQQTALWNATEEYRSDFCIPQLVARQAAITPDAVALVENGQALSYHELNRCANQLAHYLQGLDVVPNTLVGLCVERSLDMVVGLLGILKAGGAYVPLDPAYPPERLAFMLKDSAAPILVTNQHIADQLPGQGLMFVCFDTDSLVLAAQSKSEPDSKITADDLAYVIYTSGSTGQPKGVQITHKSLLNLVFWHRKAFSVTSSDRATQVASPAFDATGWELWPYLTSGASVYLPDEETRLSSILLRDWLVECQITITFLPTSLAESVLALDWPSKTALRFLLTGADVLHRYPSPTLPFVLINNYGPTEATVVSTSGQVPPVEHPDRPPSIGKPITNTQVYILDEQLKQVPIGEPGELYIGGVGLAKGYLNRPDLTAERFIPHPFSSRPGARLYKTGDLARFLPDGQIEFLGRNDQQIKIRGYRIEPGEIVAILNEHPAIETSLVIAREDIPGDKALIAYLVLKAGVHVTASSLRETLSVHLPDYMIPSNFVVLEAVPLTANGKIDRAALPMPNASKMLQDEILVSASTPLEEWLAKLVATVLGLEQVGIDQNFFLLGGHSLLATQIIMQVSEAFGVNLPLRTLFDAPTVRQLAKEIEQRVFAELEAMNDNEAQRFFQ